MPLSPSFNDSGFSPAQLLDAAARGDVKAVRAALEAGVPVDCRDAAGNTPLDFGLAQAKQNVTDLLLTHGADPLCVEETSQRNKLALRAATRGMDKALSTLLAAGVSAQLSDSEGTPLLVLAAAGGHASTVDILLKAGADVHTRGTRARSALRNAMMAKSPECVALLLAAGADPSMASEHNDREMTDHEFSRQCDPPIAEAVDAAYQKILLIRHAFRGNEKEVAELLAKGEPVNVFDHLGASALSSAATAGKAGVIRLLLEYGADPNLATRHLQTPLGLAVASGNAESVAVLLAAGAVRGAAALHEACGKKYAETARLLLADGADPNITARDTKILAEPADFFISAVLKMNADDYPFHTAVKNRDIEMMRVLAEGGASVVTKDGQGLMVLQLARESGNEDIRDIVETRYVQEMEMLAASAVQLDGQTTPMRALKFKPKGRHR